MAKTNPQYDKDFYAWTLHSAKLLRQGKFSEIDMEHIAEEIESMGGREKRELENRLAVLIAHLLKWQFQPERQCTSWKLTIKEQRIQIVKLLVQSPSLNHELIERLNQAYKNALITASKETDLIEKDFPKKCPYSLEQCMDDGFLPQ